MRQTRISSAILYICVVCLGNFIIVVVVIIIIIIIIIIIRQCTVIKYGTLTNNNNNTDTDSTVILIWILYLLCPISVYMQIVQKRGLSTIDSSMAASL